ncbi:MAG TPA: hypothetical protein VF310_14780, partial [Vicinamibacteria bacterium]
MDTRQPASPFGGPALAAGATRVFALAGACNTSPTAVAIAINVTVTQPTAAGHLRLFPDGAALPTASTISYAAGKTRANNAIVATGTAGGVAVYNGQTSGTAHVIIDVAGYFDDPANNQPPRVNAGLDQSVLMPGSISLVGTASDDGLPGPTLTYTWSKTSGPGSVTFGNASQLSTTAGFGIAGTYVLRLSANDGALTGFSEMQVRVDPTAVDARRLLDQMTFGATPAQLARLNAIGVSAFIDEQLTLPITPYPDLPMMPGTRPGTCTGACQRDNYTMYPL